MAVSFTNNWKNILDKLENILRDEFKGALPVYKGNKTPAGTAYIQLNPVGSELLEYMSHAETREFTIQILYYVAEANVKEASMEHILRTVSRVEALIHSYITMTLSDNSKAIDCRLQSTELNADEDGGMYVVEWEFKCLHTGNIS